MKLITAFMAMLASTVHISNGVGGQQRGTPSKNKGIRNKAGLPFGYPGAKLERRALTGTLTIKRSRSY